MPRKPNTRPTNIYWLYDMRSETIAVFGPRGQPFYCGKTVYAPERRFCNHRHEVSKHPNRPISRRIVECGPYVRVSTIEIVPVGDNWVDREQWWIRALRLVNPLCVNVSAGGQGVPGMVHCRLRTDCLLTFRSNAVLSQH
jgi:hypothetical protein